MKKFSTIEEAVKAIEELVNEWSDIITVTNIQTTKGKYGYFVDMKVDSVSYRFLKAISHITDDYNPMIFPIDEEIVQIGTYLYTNDSDE